ncbi:hypothetical protein AGR7C_Lc100051 [Agrobacterium deltaense Zutra 3/1]|uniref:Uncharacterized protein n=1 Tax=Agrobacterium deltaense Zutra 3/1 TaxID=1183427 RepID=A0A1S7QRJ8_9HYPH|nr:hypothetical protein AGR7C_Lc100051 [Agrobacterium deltaense Zutra 3/1]
MASAAQQAQRCRRYFLATLNIAANCSLMLPCRNRRLFRERADNLSTLFISAATHCPMRSFRMLNKVNFLSARKKQCSVGGCEIGSDQVFINLTQLAIKIVTSFMKAENLDP